MSRLPRISGRDCVKVLDKVGFYLKRQHGSHLILRRDNPFAQVVAGFLVPIYRGDSEDLRFYDVL